MLLTLAAVLHRILEFRVHARPLDKPTGQRFHSGDPKVTLVEQTQDCYSVPVWNDHTAPPEQAPILDTQL